MFDRGSIIGSLLARKFGAQAFYESLIDMKFGTGPNHRIGSGIRTNGLDRNSDRSKHKPHQGEREKARRVRQMAALNVKAA